MGFSRPEYWSGLLCPLSGNLPNPGKELASVTSSPALACGYFIVCKDNLLCDFNVKNEKQYISKVICLGFEKVLSHLID